MEQQYCETGLPKNSINTMIEQNVGNNQCESS